MCTEDLCGVVVCLRLAMSAAFRWFLSVQAAAIVSLQRVVGHPLERKYHVYYTKFITNETQLYRASFIFSAVTILKAVYSGTVAVGKPLTSAVVLRHLISGARLGVAIFCLLCVSRLALHSIKIVLRIPRPFETFEAVQADKKKKNSYSFPSQSMMSVSLIYGLIFRYWGLPLFLYVSLLGMIAISRIYRGLHYPYDIFVSLLMGDVLQRYVLNWMLAEDALGYYLRTGYFVTTVCFQLYYFLCSTTEKEKKSK